jgi:uncharacterized protein (TIGR03437 family)
MAIPEYSDTYMAALKKAANLLGGKDGWADKELTRLYGMIAEDARNEPHKQCSVSDVVLPCGPGEFESAAQHVGTYIAQREAFVVGSVGALIPNPNNPQVTSASLLGSRVTTLAPGALFEISGTMLGSSATAAAGSDLPRTLGNVWVAVDGARAPLISTASEKIQAQIAWPLRSGSATIAVVVNGAISNSVESAIAPSSLSLLALTHSNSTPVSGSAPAEKGEVLVAYAVGLGAVRGELGIGTLTPRLPLYSAVEDLRIAVGGFASAPLFAGLTPGFVGLYQVNFEVPIKCATGNSVSLIMEAGGRTTSSSLAVQ